MTDKRKENEKKFRSWTELPDGGRHYFYDVPGKHGGFARYVKEVNCFDQTTLHTTQKRPHTTSLTKVPP